MSEADTIVAIATPPGIGGIGILRLSGAEAHGLAERLCAAPVSAGKIQFRQFRGADGEPIDHGVCLYFRAPHSFTGEDCVEVQAHGGPIVLDMLLERLCKLGARLARPGEFSERAFLNDRIDLAQAEAIADLIESGSRAATRAAMRSLQGDFSRAVRRLVDEIIELRAWIEAALDFAEEEIDFLDNSAIGEKLAACALHLDELLVQAEQGRRLQEGLAVALAGLPNAGKSSLLNRLAGYEAAIVTEIEGTTRDLLREQVSLKGIPLHIVDTAGLRESDSPVEQEGVRRAWSAIADADIVLYLVDSTRGLTGVDRKILAGLPSENRQLVYTKTDLPASRGDNHPTGLRISVKSGAGMDALIDRITGDIGDLNQDRHAFVARRRHVDALTAARREVGNAISTLSATRSGELMAEDLRAAQRHLDEITGEFTTEDLLGRIFSSFCIGK